MMMLSNSVQLFLFAILKNPPKSEEIVEKINDFLSDMFYLKANFYLYLYIC